MKKLSCTVIICSLLESIIARQITLPEEAENIPARGTRDAFHYSANEYLLEERRPGSNISLNDEQYFYQSLGLKDWGVLQVSLEMTKYPEIANNKLRAPFCTISEEVLTYRQKSSLYIWNNVTNTAPHAILDHQVVKDFIYILTSALEVHCVHISPAAGNKSTLSYRWGIKSIDPDFQKVQNRTAGIGYSRSSQHLFVFTSKDSFSVDITTQTFKQISLNRNAEHLSISYVDVHNDVILVGYKNHGIDVYDARAPDGSIQFVQELNKTFFFDSKPDHQLTIGTFSIRDNMLEIFETEAGISTYQDLQDKYALLTQSYTRIQRIKYLQNNPLRLDLLVVAEASGVYLMDISSLALKGNLDKPFFKRHIPIKNASKVMRFHNFLYVLTHEPDADPLLLDPKAKLYEIYLFDRGMVNWNKDVNQQGDQEIFRANRILTFHEDVHDFYVDDRYLYISIGSEHHVYHRGVPSEYKFEEVKVAKTLQTESRQQFSKVLINGFEYLLAVGSTQVAEYDIFISDPHLKCPNFLNDEDVYGDYAFQLNVTTRHCPLKEFEGYNLTTVSKMVCNFQKNITLGYSPGYIYERKSGFKTILSLLLAILLILLSICCYCARVKANLQKEYEIVKKQVGMLPNTSRKDDEFMKVQSTGSERDGPPLEFAEEMKESPQAPKDEEVVNYTDEN